MFSSFSCALCGWLLLGCEQVKTNRVSGTFFWKKKCGCRLMWWELWEFFFWSCHVSTNTWAQCKCWPWPPEGQKQAQLIFNWNFPLSHSALSLLPIHMIHMTPAWALSQQSSAPLTRLCSALSPEKASWLTLRCLQTWGKWLEFPYSDQ